MNIRSGFIGAVGDTSLIRLGTLSEITGCQILGKAEYTNPGCSVKDRAGWIFVENNVFTLISMLYA